MTPPLVIVQPLGTSACRHLFSCSIVAVARVPRNRPAQTGIPFAEPADHNGLPVEEAEPSRRGENPLSTPYPHLFTPITIGSISLPNRFVMGSMHTLLEEMEDGFTKTGAFFAERAKHGVGLMVTGGVGPNQAGRLADDEHTLEREQQVADHRLITTAVHNAGGKILMQILHPGRYGQHDKLVAPSAIRAPINKRVPHPLTDTEVEQTIEEFVNCARLAQSAGYDGVEIMGSEG
ncbi:MAG TPA: hypothetical protein DCF45_02180, partial [Gammaproteobacteria bacterium]|nr:hypothetical protein [Gammaproteobacteria bacterium]